MNEWLNELREKWINSWVKEKQTINNYGWINELMNPQIKIFST